jgi:hypothetical protein
MDIHGETIKTAYDLWEQSGRKPGRDLDNWIEAERIVKAKGKEKGAVQKDSNKNKLARKRRRKE